MKRLLLACLGMVLLGTAGLLILHQVVESPSAAVAQPSGPPAGAPAGTRPGGGSRPAGEPGQYKDIVPALLGALADPDGNVRQLAADTLVKIGPDAVPPLIDALKAKDRETRANAAYVLGQLGESARDALPALAKALKDDDKEVRRRAAFALHNIVSRTETVAAVAAASPEEGPGTPGGVTVPRMAARAYAPGMQTPLDPGLLVPAVSPPGKPEKEQKKN
jgi:hypothetical protein